MFSNVFYFINSFVNVTVVYGLFILYLIKESPIKFFNNTIYKL